MSTTYMNLTLPVVGTTLGPLYATQLNAALTTVDAHNHSVGSGQQITPSGISITADLSFGSNNATLLRSTRYVNQSGNLVTATDVGCIFVKGYELYYNDNSGNHVQITSGGAVAGTPGSIGSLTSPASVNYSAPTFVFQSDSLIPGNLDAGSVIIREVLVSAKGITLSSPAALAADYTLTLPAALPASTKILSLSSAGVVAAAYAVDNSSIEISSNTIQVKAAGITNAMLAGSIDGATKIAAGSITSVELGSNAVTTAKILAANVTDAKMAPNTLTGASIVSSINLPGFPFSNSKYLISSQTNAASGLGLLRGAIAAAGTIDIGEGFTTSTPSGLVRRITFTTAFASAPVVTFSQYVNVTGDFANWYVSSVSTTFFEVTGVAAQPAGFTFIAIGPRS